MKARPILFSSSMIRALLAGTKSQTRRIVKEQYAWSEFTISARKLDSSMWRLEGSTPINERAHGNPVTFVDVACPYGRPGDLLWVREAWCRAFDGPGYLYSATETEHVVLVDGDGFAATDSKGRERSPWKPSIHMPRCASRLTLRITDVRVQRLKDIDGLDAIAEGIQRVDGEAPWRTYKRLWNEINGPGSWDANPWVWAVSFETIRKNVDDVSKEANAELSRFAASEEPK